MSSLILPGSGLPVFTPAQLAGVLDGDGHLGVRHERTNGETDRFGRVVLTMRDDDPTPVIAAVTLAEACDRAIGRLGRTPGRRLVTWRLQAADDLLELLEFLRSTPLISARGFIQLRVLATLAESVSSGERRTSDQAGKALIRERRADAERSLTRLSTRVPYSLNPAVARLPDDVVAGYLVGFFLAEGWVGLSGAVLRPQFVITQRIDGRGTLDELCRRTGLGHVYTYHASPTGFLGAMWRVSGERQCIALGDLLRSAPIPLVIPKGRRLERWIEALRIRRDCPRGRRGVLLESEAVAAYSREIRGMSAYGGAHPLVLAGCPDTLARANFIGGREVARRLRALVGAKETPPTSASADDTMAPVGVKGG
jgi:hypothetical protein